MSIKMKDAKTQYSFKSTTAFNEFMCEAMTLETNLSHNLHHDHCEMLYLYVDDDTGHIITWYREHNPASLILDAQYGIYHKIPWQIRQTA